MAAGPRPSNRALLDVHDLFVEFEILDRKVPVVDGVSFSIGAGEIVGLVGESGSGKSVTILSVLGLIPPPGRIGGGGIIFRGRNLLELEQRELREIRGRDIALIPPDAIAALNPIVRTGDQVAEAVRSHRSGLGRAQAQELVVEMFRRVGLPNPALQYYRYPHELSGGMQQRALIASALLLSPALILADEPTTALDVTIQAQILHLLLDVRREFGTAIVFVTHDLSAVAEICDRVLVMYAGHIVENASVGNLFSRPLHPYTRALMASVPPLCSEPPATLEAIAGTPPDPGSWPSGCRFAARCALRAELGNPDVCGVVDPPLLQVGPGHTTACHFSTPTALRSVGVTGSADAMEAVESESADAEETAMLTIRPSAITPLSDKQATAALLEIDGVSRMFWGPRKALLGRGTTVRAVDHVSFDVAPGEAFGLVGESGSGKTTIGRMIVKLIEPTSGRIRFRGTDISTLSGSDKLVYCRGIQMVFQSPYASLNPRRRVRDMISEAFDIHGIARGPEAEEKMAALMQKVGLSPAMLNRYPHQFSSGQRQRIAIARALSVDPALVVADEPVSALDVSVQAQVLNLLRRLQVEVGVALIFISHDLRAVSFMCERIGVLYLGQIVEIGLRRGLVERPVHPYTRALFRSLPSLTPGQGVARDLIVGEIADQAPAAEGCVFAPRCELRNRLGKPGRCETERPILREVRSGQLAACHFAEELVNEQVNASGVTVD